MTIRYGAKAFDPASLPWSETVERRRVSELASNFQIPIGAAATDTVIFGRIPSHCKVSPGSIMRHGALTTTTSVNVGLYTEASPMVIGAGVANCLIAAYDPHLAGTKDFTAAITPDLADKFAWELAGLASDPGGFLLVVLTTVTGTSTAAAWFDMRVSYRTS